MPWQQHGVPRSAEAVWLLQAVNTAAGGQTRQGRASKNHCQARGLMGSPTVPSTRRLPRSWEVTHLSSSASRLRIRVGAVYSCLTWFHAFAPSADGIQCLKHGCILSPFAACSRCALTGQRHSSMAC